MAESLRAQLAEVVSQKAADLAAVEARYTDTIKAIREALIALGVSQDSLLSAVEDQPSETEFSVGEEKMAAIRQFIFDHIDGDNGGLVRQADIATMVEKAFGVSANSASGTASTAVKRLWMVEHLIVPAPKIRGSNTWRVVSRPAAA